MTSVQPFKLYMIFPKLCSWYKWCSNSSDHGYNWQKVQLRAQNLCV